MSFLIGLAVVAFAFYWDWKRPKPTVLAPNGCYITSDILVVNLPGMYQLEYHYPTSEDGKWRVTEHYRFEGTEMYSRCIEDKRIAFNGEIEWKIRDGIVLDEWIKERERMGFISFIENAKERVEWSVVRNDVLRLFAMSKHPDRFSKDDILEMAYGKINTIKTEAQKAIQYAQSIGFLVKERPENDSDDLYFVGEKFFVSPEDWPIERRKQARQALDEFFNSLTISEDEFHCAKEYTTLLTDFIKEHLLLTANH